MFARLIALTSVLVLSGSAFAQAPPPALSKAEAIKGITSTTHIGICANADEPVFTDVRTAPGIPWNIAQGNRETKWLMPVKADYTVHCTQGNRNMHYGPVTEWQVEVHGDFRLYKDAFGDLRMANGFDDPYYWDDQDWNNAHADVRCRAKKLAMVSYDAAGNVTKRDVEPESKAYGSCNVRMLVQK